MIGRIVYKALVRRRALLVMAGAAASLTALVSASSALAVERHPTGEFALFNDCPLGDATLSECLYAETSSGEVTVGKRTVPITNTIILQGGFHTNEETGVLEFVGAENGETLSKTPQPVPGGLLNVVAPEFLPGFLRAIVNSLVSEGLAGVTATTELAAPASHIGLSTENLLAEEEIALTLPIKVKLSNTFLGEECYIGSNSAPIAIEFTTGATTPPSPNKSISGTAGTLTRNAGFTFIKLTGSRLVNNSFAAPEAKGCGGLLSFLIDPAVNAELGLPAAAGTNTAILEGDESEGAAKTVRESE